MVGGSGQEICACIRRNTSRCNPSAVSVPRAHGKTRESGGSLRRLLRPPGRISRSVPGSLLPPRLAATITQTTTETLSSSWPAVAMIPVFLPPLIHFDYKEFSLVGLQKKSLVGSE